MSHFVDTAKRCLNEIQQVVEQLNENEMNALANEIQQAKRIFIHGEGRSGLMGKAIAMRLMHADYDVYVTGETITPSISNGDLLLIISGSASGTENFSQKAKASNANVVLVTANRSVGDDHPSDLKLFIPAATKQRLPHEPKTIQPLGNQFDQSVHIVLDAVIVALTTDQQEEMKERHANLE
ncbi:6-phospho-3-hexuloisomerase [Geomicrobium sp. JCM 19038]|uniref:6-phospho-3-hexuloisomerase n=1 Tax=Geomicrobium sp. JCM 19038 TaxID=1460635 RepID=UPI00045F4357|nr:6-phospho-3-hexuloisomerase [Geomicrobium sp. JCM 19038]GAK10112.1 6-phospho-3-hexuloisomerase [Geomicrobium sp. JCM 19038]